MELLKNTTQAERNRYIVISTLRHRIMQDTGVLVSYEEAEKRYDAAQKQHKAG